MQMCASIGLYPVHSTLSPIENVSASLSCLIESANSLFTATQALVNLKSSFFPKILRYFLISAVSLHPERRNAHSFASLRLILCLSCNLAFLWGVLMYFDSGAIALTCCSR